MKKSTRNAINLLLAVTQDYVTHHKKKCKEYARCQGASIVFELAADGIYMDVLDMCEAEDIDFIDLDEVWDFFSKNGLTLF